MQGRAASFRETLTIQTSLHISSNDAPYPRPPHQKGAKEFWVNSRREHLVSLQALRHSSPGFFVICTIHWPMQERTIDLAVRIAGTVDEKHLANIDLSLASVQQLKHHLRGRVLYMHNGIGIDVKYVQHAYCASINH